ncbi:MAG: hypothetical protein K2Q14_06155 [Gammaproteobacteria bacterium]|nr:hypothetical protein [Gammaproteobacteria bacterium]
MLHVRDYFPLGLAEKRAFWQTILMEEKSDAVKDISALSLGQKNVLHYLATQQTTLLTSKQAMLNLKMSSSSIVAALVGLEEKDVIEKVENEYQIISPIVHYYASK